MTVQSIQMPVTSEEPMKSAPQFARVAHVETTQVVDLANKAMLAGLSVSVWGARKAAKPVAAEGARQFNASEDQLTASKRLVAKERLEDINKLVSEARGWHRDHTQPWLDDGQRILPAALYLEYSKVMSEYRQKFEATVAEFLRDYPVLVTEAQGMLGNLFDVADYPTPEKVGEKFRFATAVVPLPTGADFRVNLGRAQMDKIRADIDARTAEGIRQAMAGLWGQIHQVVSAMVERLNAYKPAVVGADGKVEEKAEGIFRDSLVQNVRELVGLLPAMNLTGDARLAALSERLERELCGVEAEDLRNSDGARAMVAKSAEDILKEMEGYV